MRAGVALAATAALLAGCAQVSESYTGRTATEQLLLARAADQAVEGLELPVEKSARIFVDNAYFQAEGAAYAISAVRQALSEAGHALASDKASADVILEMRAGTLALEQMRRVVGIPPLAVPINENLNVVSLPELSLYSRRDRTGVAEFSAFVYDARTGAPLGVVQPMIGEFRIRSHKVLMIVAWGQQWADPGEADPGDSWTAF
ncbi:MAG: DUF6655 family protein [Brevundimonas sp.]